jgi:hypothetical protein
MSKEKNENGSSAGTEEKDMLLVSSKVKAYIKSKNFMTSGDALDALNEKVYRLIDEALARTEANKRQTLKPTDL